MTRTRSLIRVALIAIVAATASLLAGGRACRTGGPASVIGTGSGRAGASVAAVVALIGVVTGGLALARSHRTG